MVTRRKRPTDYKLARDALKLSEYVPLYELYTFESAWINGWLAGWAARGRKGRK